MSSTFAPLLERLPLFTGIETGSFAGLIGEAHLESGRELWRQGQAADALFIVKSGRLEVLRRLPGDRHVNLATLGPGDVFGELALLGDGIRTATVRAAEPTHLFRLPRAAFRSLVVGRDDAARTLRRRLLEVACRRLLNRHEVLASTLPGVFRPAVSRCGRAQQPPDQAYLLRLPFFSDYHPNELDELVRRSCVEEVSAGERLVAEGGPPRALFVTLRGAVEQVIDRGDRTIRVALHGPGRPFGYASLIRNGSATATATARERSVVLVVELEELEHQLAVDTFATAVERGLVSALHQAEQPQARLAATPARMTLDA